MPKKFASVTLKKAGKPHQFDTLTELQAAEREHQEEVRRSFSKDPLTIEEHQQFAEQLKDMAARIRNGMLHKHGDERDVYWSVVHALNGVFNAMYRLSLVEHPHPQLEGVYS